MYLARLQKNLKSLCLFYLFLKLFYLVPNVNIKNLIGLQSATPKVFQRKLNCKLEYTARNNSVMQILTIISLICLF